MSESNSVRLDLCQLRKRATALLRAVKSGDPASVARFTTAGVALTPDPQLALAQWVVAREQGHDSWPKLKHAWERQDQSRSALATALVEAALDQDLTRVTALLHSDKALARWNLATALVCGESEVATELLEEDPTLATRLWSNRLMPALFLCTRSCLVPHAKGDAAGFADCIRALVRLGADVNLKFPFDDPFASANGTPLYYVAGVHGHHALTKLLLELGATPNDGETLYHAVEKRDPQLLRIIHTASGGVDLAQWSYAFLHLCDFEAPDSLRTMLSLGVDLTHRHPGTGETALHWAIMRGRSPEVIGILLAAGASPSTPDFAGITPYGLAARCGDLEAAALIERSGHHERLSPVEELFLAASRNDPHAVAAIRQKHPGVSREMTPSDARTLVRVAALGRTNVVRGLLHLAQLDPATRDENGATALHNACAHGHADTVATLLAFHAPLEATDPMHHATPLGWAVWGSQNLPNPPPTADYPRIVDLILSAGAKVQAVMGGSPAVRAVLRQHGVPLTD